MMTTPHLFCFGLGYSALVLIERLQAEGWRVSGTCRSEAKAAQLRQRGISVFLWTGEEALPPEALHGVSHLLSSVPTSAAPDPVLATCRTQMAAQADTLQWIGYLSTVGVYGDWQGAWVDENTVPRPGTMLSRQRLAAEWLWQAFGVQYQVPTHIFRLPGIYGPGGRNSIDSLKSGKARRIVKPGQVFNRIHVADIATVLQASMRQPGAATVFNVSDDLPAAADEVLCFAAELLGVEPPAVVPFEAAELSGFAAHFYQECKRVDNQRIKTLLGVTLQYPDYRAGLRQILSLAKKSEL